MPRKVFERPGMALLELLYKTGIEKLGSRMWLSKQKLRTHGFQHAAVEMLLKETYIVEDQVYRSSPIYEEEYRDRIFKLFYGQGSEETDAIITAKPVSKKIIASWMDVMDLMPSTPFPLFVIDLSMKFIHTEEELSSLKVQLAMSLNVIRDYLWDAHLVITSVGADPADWLAEVLGYHKATITSSKPSEVLWGMDADKVIILRPDAPQPLTSGDVLTADAFLIGGIVDRIPRPGISRVLDNLVPWGLPRRMELRGSIIGVPERINRIIEILLKARYNYRGDVERAIISTMTKKDVMARLHVEISRRARRRGSTPIVSWRLYEELAKWLPITREDFEKAAAKAQARIVEEG
ncbi:MAG: tRNA (guanine-N1)-methyltransferase [Desulfurococcales archaeon]|nr:tRNA (guanine-N1)-methyltransferase [Desulfurococcales archaeon]